MVVIIIRNVNLLHGIDLHQKNVLNAVKCYMPKPISMEKESCFVLMKIVQIVLKIPKRGNVLMY